jgi:hypothetical protein
MSLVSVATFLNRIVFIPWKLRDADNMHPFWMVYLMLNHQRQ